MEWTGGGATKVPLAGNFCAKYLSVPGVPSPLDKIQGNYEILKSNYVKEQNKLF
jgi:hypothetical protein